VPPNCSFEVDDAEDEWLFGEPFSYIHARSITTCFKDGLQVIRSAYESLAPGGYLEIQDPSFPMSFADPQPPPDSAYVRWQDLIIESAAKTGRPWTHPSSYKAWFEQAGFVDIREEKFFWPTGTWCEEPHLKEIGAWSLVNAFEIIEALAPRILTPLGWGIEEIKIFVAQVREEIKKERVKLYCMFWCVYGRKPESELELEVEDKRPAVLA
jgi:hypothetical protein